MITIYHNPRCSKSRQSLAILEEQNLELEIIKYLETSFTEDTLSHIISLLSIQPIELIRKNEQIWKDNYKGKEFSDRELIKLMIDNPKLIERPIVINGKKAVIGRPPEKINTIL